MRATRRETFDFLNLRAPSGSAFVRRAMLWPGHWDPATDRDGGWMLPREPAAHRVAGYLMRNRDLGKHPARARGEADYRGRTTGAREDTPRLAPGLRDEQRWRRYRKSVGRPSPHNALAKLQRSLIRVA